jgi:hypothetical protein
MRWAALVVRIEEERHIQGFGRETGGEETTWEIQA